MAQQSLDWFYTGFVGTPVLDEPRDVSVKAIFMFFLQFKHSNTNTTFNIVVKFNSGAQTGQWFRCVLCVEATVLGLNPTHGSLFPISVSLVPIYPSSALELMKAKRRKKPKKMQQQYSTHTHTQDLHLHTG